ncbi:MBL fold metallo-hydrolase [Ornithinimicrobium cerasi]|uniref:Glyoxylase, beta-lactamase superfamily II n=1 Tax=Ornithinimicrobium cerasi TaxID=2248773 RepID=A0A285VSS8_9MICO|nr:MBL fold metallo-hydrolase [Ornithinimicrobium cerasi]SOC56286.1 Glyoxylase, beta-lactamase superfamily II [Ornithinimicrobium cerasi]
MRGAPPADPAWQGGGWGERAVCVLCPNPSPMTLEGTNTWVLAEPGSRDVVVVDPGPLDEQHLRTVLDHVAGRDARVALTLLTHGHADHAESAPRWAGLTGAPVRAVGRGHDDLAAGETLRVGGLELLVVPTPGHTADSVSFLLPAEQVLLTGDTVLGRGTTVVAYPDGDLTSYLDSLARLERLTRSGAATSIAPGHGPVVPDAAGTVEYYLTHRHERLEQVRAAVAELREGTRELADAVVERVYADVPRSVWPAARLSVLAQLDYLGEL